MIKPRMFAVAIAAILFDLQPTVMWESHGAALKNHGFLARKPLPQAGW
jgi:hypothetical protein